MPKALDDLPDDRLPLALVTLAMLRSNRMPLHYPAHDEALGGVIRDLALCGQLRYVEDELRGQPMLRVTRIGGEVV